MLPVVVFQSDDAGRGNSVVGPPRSFGHADRSRPFPPRYFTANSRAKLEGWENQGPMPRSDGSPDGVTTPTLRTDECALIA